MSIKNVHDWRKVRVMSPLTETVYNVVFTREGKDLAEKVDVAPVGENRDRIAELEAYVVKGPVEPVHETDTLADATKGEVKRPAPKPARKSKSSKSSAKKPAASKSKSSSKSSTKSSAKSEAKKS